MNFLQKGLVFILLIGITISIQGRTLDKLWWLPFQAVPGYMLSSSERVNHGLNWEVTPVFIPFAPGKYQDDVKFFLVEPVLRHTGGFEWYVELELFPENAGNTRYKSGGRFFFPVIDMGETLGIFAGSGKEIYSAQGIYIEAGFFTFYSLFQLGFTRYYHSDREWSISLQLRYF